MVRRIASGVVSVSLLLAAAALPGCDTIARSQGKFPIASSFGSEAISKHGEPLNENLYVPSIKSGKPDPSEMVPLVRVAYRDPWCGDLVNTSDGGGDDAQHQSYYMVIDVTNVIRDPRLGSHNDAEFKARLRAIAEMLIIAADWNGETYWRHLTAFLETYGAVNTASKAALGSSIAASFINPILGASLAGGALIADTFITDYTGSLNVDEYAAMRDAASTYRKVIKQRLFNEINDAKPGSDAVNGVLQQAYDYAFTYSIKGAIHAATQQNKELKSLLITGDSEWRQYFTGEIKRHQRQLLRDGKITDTAEKTRLETLFKAEDDAEMAREKSDRENQTAIDAERRAAALDKAKADRLREAEQLARQELTTAEAQRNAEVAKAKAAAAARAEAAKAANENAAKPAEEKPKPDEPNPPAAPPN